MNTGIKKAFLFGMAAVLIVHGLSGCDKKDEKEGGEEKAKTSLQELGETGLKGEVPAGANVGKALIGDGVMVQGPGLVATVEEASATRPENLEGAKKDAEMYNPQNIETEELGDGWAFSFENTGSMGTNYFVWVRRKIGGKDWWCSTTGSEAAHKKNTLAFCKSLQQ